jgi:hypothetical protein
MDDTNDYDEHCLSEMESDGSEISDGTSHMERLRMESIQGDPFEISRVRGMDSNDEISWRNGTRGSSQGVPEPRGEMHGRRLSQDGNSVMEQRSIAMSNRRKLKVRHGSDSKDHDAGNRRSTGRTTGRPSWRVNYSSTEIDTEDEEPQHSRKRRRPESEAGTGQKQYAKKRKFCDKKVCDSNKDTDRMLDKFLSIIKQVRSSDKPKINCNTNVIPEFDPMLKDQSASIWLTKVDECAAIYGWDERETIHYSLPKLSGVAKTWYQGLGTLLYTWPEWKKKILESFPCNEDYAELLTEMLTKRCKYGDSLEHYYYAKVNLLNRCKISGKHAVDCLLHGVEERTVKIGAKAANFREPEQVLEYFKNVKVGQPRDQLHLTKYNDRRTITTYNRPGFSKSEHTNNNNNKIRCFNCHELGHPVYKCDKAPKKCTLCFRYGHLAEECRNSQMKKPGNENDHKTKKVLQVSEVT